MRQEKVIFALRLELARAKQQLLQWQKWWELDGEAVSLDTVLKELGALASYQFCIYGQEGQ